MKATIKKTRNALLAVGISLLPATICFSQGVGINTSGSAADNSALLDVSGTDKGVLIPRIALTSVTDVTTIQNPAVSLLVYNNGAGGLNPAGFYYWDGSQWKNISLPGPAGATGVGIQGAVGATGGGIQGATGPTGYAAQGATGATGAGPLHYIGEYYGGGVIGYIYTDATGTEHGLIVSQDDVGSAIVWTTASFQSTSVPTCSSCTGCTTVSAGAQSPYNGLCNSNAILSQNSNGSCAALSCKNYTGGGNSDWYLPAIDEWSAIGNSSNVFNRACDIDGNSATVPISRDFYWSSTEMTASYGYAYAFRDIYPPSYWGLVVKSLNYYVRCVRTF